MDAIQQIVKSSINFFLKSLSKVDLGIQGIEDADTLTKNTALNPRREIYHYIEKSDSYLKKILKELMTKEWQFK